MSVQPEFSNPEPVDAHSFPIVLRFEGLHPRDLGRFRMHDERRGGDLTHVDPELRALNEILVGEPDWIPQLRADILSASRENLAAHLAALRAKSRVKEANDVQVKGLVNPWRECKRGPLREGILTVNKAWFGGTGHARWDPNKVEKFRDRALAFLGENFPDGQLCYASAHSDEEAYHIHFVVTVWHERKTQNRGKQCLLQSSKNALVANYEHAQTIAGEAFSDLGLTRGTCRAEAIRLARERGEAVPEKRKHVPPSTRRATEKLNAHIYAARSRKAAMVAAREVVARSEMDAATKLDEAQASVENLLNVARELATSTVRKSRKKAIKDAKARKAEIARNERFAAQDLEQLAAAARREGRAAAESLSQKMAAQAAVKTAEAERLIAELSAQEAVSQAKAAEMKQVAAEAACRNAGAALAKIRDVSGQEVLRLKVVTAEVEAAELRMRTAVVGAEAVEAGLDLFARDVLHPVEGRSAGRPKLVWGDAAPQAEAERREILKSVEPVLPMLSRIAAVAWKTVRKLLTSERQKLAKDAAFVAALRDDWGEEQKARLREIGGSGSGYGEW